jgi:hypothetical protein
MPRFYVAGAGGVTTKHSPAVARPPRSYGQRLELAEDTSPRGLPCHCIDKASDINYVPLNICRVILLLLRHRRVAAGLGELQ